MVQNWTVQELVGADRVLPVTEEHSQDLMINILKLLSVMVTDNLGN